MENIRITNPEPIPPGESWSISQEELELIAKRKQGLVNIRGIIIEYMVNIERGVDEIISRCFAGEGQDKFLITAVLLEELSSSAKIRVLERLLSNQHNMGGPLRYKKILKNVESKKFLKNLRKVNEIRNRFAHGEIAFKGTQPAIFSSRNRIEEVTESKLENAFNLFETVLKELNQILQQDVEKQ